MKRSIIYLSLALLILTPFNSILALETNYRYTGQELDQEINLYNYGARYYNPEIGRFNGPDPVLNDNSIDSFFLNNSNREELNKFLSGPQRLNAYSYTLNNPVKYVDPSGEDPMVWDYTTDVMFFNESLSDYNQNKSLGNALALGADALGLALPILPAGTGSLFKSFAKGVNTLVDMWKQSRAVKTFDAVAQQSKMLEGIVNSKAINVIKDIFRDTDKIPGGTMGALRNEIMTGLKTGNKFHEGKAWNTINRLNNIFKNETLSSVEMNRLQGIKNSLESLIKEAKNNNL